VSAIIVKHDVPEFWYHFWSIMAYWIVYMYIKSPARSDDENSRLSFSNRENVIDKIWFVEFASFW
jgi:hypothetical protein